MKLRKYKFSPLIEPIQWARWAFLGRLPGSKRFSRPARPQGPARSLFLRHLDCGSCNGCELALHALNTPHYDLPGRGIHFVASPRHADWLVMTGPLTINMVDVALATLHQLPQPRVLVLGDCAIDGGPFKDAYGVVPLSQRPAELKKAIMKSVPGCPPEPEDIWEELFRK